MAVLDASTGLMFTNQSATPAALYGNMQGTPQQAGSAPPAPATPTIAGLPPTPPPPASGASGSGYYEAPGAPAPAAGAAPTYQPYSFGTAASPTVSTAAGLTADTGAGLGTGTGSSAPAAAPAPATTVTAPAPAPAPAATPTAAPAPSAADIGKSVVGAIQASQLHALQVAANTAAGHPVTLTDPYTGKVLPNINQILSQYGLSYGGAAPAPPAASGGAIASTPTFGAPPATGTGTTAGTGTIAATPAPAAPVVTGTGRTTVAPTNGPIYGSTLPTRPNVPSQVLALAGR
jgi:hypothetical protein